MKQDQGSNHLNTPRVPGAMNDERGTSELREWRALTDKEINFILLNFTST